ncbi:MAG: hypothetical protein IJN19_04790 [Opitutales bacterium]|nr:hypothetical protein [Opitutales bacterium]
MNSPSFNYALQKLQALVAEVSPCGNLNEAGTRFKIIDSLIEILGWNKKITNVEVYEKENGFTDYELGCPRKVIVEAKRQGVVFDLPVGLEASGKAEISLLQRHSQSLKDAINQAQEYCASRGVAIACICNGHQLVIFIAVKTNGSSPLEGEALVFSSLKDIVDRFSVLWNVLSVPGVDEGRIFDVLEEKKHGIPIKWSTQVRKNLRYPSDLQASLKAVADLLILDIPENRELQGMFYEQCYCESGALSKYALSSKELIKARYNALFSDIDSDSTIVVPVKKKKSKHALDSSVILESLSKRPIILIGDVGVGKTTFVKNLFLSNDTPEFKNALYLYVDLGSEAALSDLRLSEYVKDRIVNLLTENYGVDIYERHFLNGVYSSEIVRFSKGLYAPLKETDPVSYEKEKIRMLEELMKNKSEHLKRSLSHYAKAAKKQIIIFLDNADQRDFEFQQQAFLISQELAVGWNSLVFISVRPLTFYKSKSAGILTAYPHKIYTIAPPRIEDVVRKRLIFAEKISKREIPLPLDKMRGANWLQIPSFTAFATVLIRSLEKNKDLNEFLENVTGGNVRLSLTFIRDFIGSSNVDTEKIIGEENSSYLIPIHEFSKQALLGDYSYFDSNSSIALNLFDVSESDKREHFITPILLAFLNQKTFQNADGFVLSDSVFKELQRLGFKVSQIEWTLKRSINRKLIELPSRFTFDEDDARLLNNKRIDGPFRVTSLGLYHIARWIGEFAYLDAISVDTPIFEKEADDQIGKMFQSGSFNISIRLRRTKRFRDYLLAVWRDFGEPPSYFDFAQSIKAQSDSFVRVETAVNQIYSATETLKSEPKSL